MVRTGSANSRVCVLINPKARTNRRDMMDAETVHALIGESEVFITQDCSEVEEFASVVLREPPDLLVVSGGDGTLHILLTHLLNKVPSKDNLPAFLVLRGGTMNMAAANLSTLRAPLMELRVLDHFLKQQLPFAEWPLRTVHPLRVDSDHLRQSLFGFVFANGIAFRILNEYYRGPPSVTRAFNVTASIIAGAFMSKEMEKKFFSRLNATVIVDGQVVGRKDLRISVASAIPKLLLWFTVFEGHPPLEQDQFYFLANFLPTKEIARHFWGLCRGGWEGPGHINRPVKRVEMQGAGGFTIDGEVYDIPEGKGLCTITAGPLLRFLDLSGFSPPGHSWLEMRPDRLSEQGMRQYEATR